MAPPKLKTAHDYAQLSTMVDFIVLSIKLVFMVLGVSYSRVLAQRPMGCSYLPTIPDFPELLRKSTSNYGITARAKLFRIFFDYGKLIRSVTTPAKSANSQPAIIDLCRHLPRKLFCVRIIYGRWHHNYNGGLYRQFSFAVIYKINQWVYALWLSLCLSANARFWQLSQLLRRRKSGLCKSLS